MLHVWISNASYWAGKCVNAKILLECMNKMLLRGEKQASYLLWDKGAIETELSYDIGKLGWISISHLLLFCYF